MGGKHEMLRDGAETRAVVTRRTSRGAGTDLRQSLQARVHFDDGSTVEFSGQAFLDEVGYISEGDIVPVRYDPSDHSTVALDVAALKAQRSDRHAASEHAKPATMAHRERED